MSTFPMVVTADQMAENDRMKAEAQNEEQSKTEEKQMSELAAYIRSIWPKAVEANRTVHALMIDDLRQRNMEYSPAKLAAIRSIRQAESYAPLTNTKCRSMESLVRDVVCSPGKRPFALEPTPIPELPAEIEKELTQKFYQEAIYQLMMSSMTPMNMQPDSGVQPTVAENAPVPMGGMPSAMMDTTSMMQTVQEMLPEFQKRLKKLIMDKAKEACEEMTQEINDQFVEGGWYKAMYWCIYDIVTLRACILKGPIARREIVTTLKTNPATGMLEPVDENRIIDQYDHTSPLNFFPLWDTGNVDNGDIMERMYYQPSELSGLIGVGGYKDDEIKAVLKEYTEHGLSDWETENDQDQAEQEQLKKDGSPEKDRTKICCIEWWGSVPGKKLKEFGLEKEDGTPLDDDQYYHAKAWLIGTHIIKASLNDDPNGKKLYSVACAEDIPDSIWGRGLPAILKHLQDALNAYFRLAQTNAGIASGPQVVVNQDMFPEGYDFTIYPNKVYVSTTDLMAAGQKPMEFLLAPFVVDKLNAAYDFYSKIADEITIPSYAHGDSQVGGAGNTLGGLSMLMKGAVWTREAIVRNIDEDLITTSVQRQFYKNLRNNPRKMLVGDVKVVARGSSHLISQEQEAIRMMEFARNTNNNLDAMVTGLEGRRYLLTEVAKALNIDPEKAFP
ncbi:MAG: hypothetical protein EHM49_06970, partial [Deltaproteobacteria bacterium]